MRLIEFILMLSGALIWTGVFCGVIAFAIFKLMNLEDRE